MKMLIEYLPVLVFFGAYVTTDIYTATAVFMVAATVLALGHRLVTGEWHKVHLMVAALALVFGGLTLILHDPLFFKLKPSVLYAIFALVLIGSAFIGDKPIMQRLLGSQLELPAPIWRKLTFMWAGFFIFCGLLNLYIAFNFSEAFWVNFKLFGTLGLTLVFALAQGVYLSQHMPDQSDDSKES